MVDLAILSAQQFAFGPATVECVLDAAARHQVPGNLLLAVASNESGRNGDAVVNRNRSRDIGHFQFNTDTIRTELAPLGVRLADLQWKGCYNAEVAAFLVARRLAEPGGDYWSRAANYHNRKPVYNAIYRRRLIVNAQAWSRWLASRYTVTVSYR